MSDERVTDLICLQGISHTYSTGASSQAVLHDISLSIPAGQSCAIVGASGSGKSTLLNIIGLLDQPVSGRLLLAGQDMSQASADDRAIVRNQVIGFVFQSFNLLPRLDRKTICFPRSIELHEKFISSFIENYMFY
ncbi:ATP-binding cassette domain-containing protein [Pectobacterium aquaticum]|nr:ATP-binding cassette domain-containing protein [Pectobacterium aquaticum]